MGGFYGPVVEIVPLHSEDTPIYFMCKGGWEMWFTCVPREEGMGALNRELVSAKQTNIFTLKDCDKDQR